MSTRRTAAALFALALGSCETQSPRGDSKETAPVQGRSTTPNEGPGAAGLPAGHPAVDGLPAGHPKVDELPAGHPPVSGEAPRPHRRSPSAPAGTSALLERVEAMKAELRDKPKTFEVASALGNLYYDNGRYVEAIDHYGQALTKASEALSVFDELHGEKVKNLAPVEKAPSLEESLCDRSNAKDLEALVKRARDHRTKGKRAAAKVCAREALRPVTALFSRRASAYFLLGNPEQAVEEHERALERDPAALESLFFVGAIHFDAHGDDVPRLERAAEAWKRFAKLTEPSHPRHDVVVRMLPEIERAIEAGGVSKVKPAAEPAPSPSRPAADITGGTVGQASLPPVSKEMMEAIESTPRGPELDAALARYVEQGEEALARGDGETAAQLYRSVMPYQPKNARAQAGMAAAQLLKGSGMAERVLAAAVESDPAAVDLLADRLKQKGNAALAKTIWQKLSVLAPDYSQKAGLSAKMGSGR